MSGTGKSELVRTALALLIMNDTSVAVMTNSNAATNKLADKYGALIEQHWDPSTTRAGQKRPTR